MRMSKVQPMHSTCDMKTKNVGHRQGLFDPGSRRVPQTRGAAGYVRGQGNVVTGNTTKSSAGNSQDG